MGIILWDIFCSEAAGPQANSGLGYETTKIIS